jgi:hypothetical protein
VFGKVSYRAQLLRQELQLGETEGQVKMHKTLQVHFEKVQPGM